MEYNEVNPLSDARIVESWFSNAIPWVKAVREGKIESRILVTNEAILKAINEHMPNKVIDIGCGEGWLANRLVEAGIDTLGIDVVPAMIAQARSNGSARFQVSAYEMLAQGVIRETFDIAVCNFSLLGESSVNHLFSVLPGMLNKGGSLIVQTVHPAFGCGNFPYKDGWRTESWTGFDMDFNAPAPWYFRTMESWLTLFDRSGMRLKAVREPLHPETGKPASIIFIGEHQVCRNL